MKKTSLKFIYQCGCSFSNDITTTTCNTSNLNCRLLLCLFNFTVLRSEFESNIPIEIATTSGGDDVPKTITSDAILKILNLTSNSSKFGLNLKRFEASAPRSTN